MKQRRLRIAHVRVMYNVDKDYCALSWKPNFIQFVVAWHNFDVMRCRSLFHHLWLLLHGEHVHRYISLNINWKVFWRDVVFIAFSKYIIKFYLNFLYFSCCTFKKTTRNAIKNLTARAKIYLLTNVFLNLLLNMYYNPYLCRAHVNILCKH